MNYLNQNQITTIKCYFSSILNKSNLRINEYKQLIQDSITDINIIISLLYDYIKFKILYDYNNDFLNTLNLDNRNDINTLLRNLLNIGKDTTYKQFLDNNKFYYNIPDRNRTTEILKEVLNNIITNIKVNIQEHYIQHLLKFVKLTINNYDNNKENKLKFYSFVLNMEYNNTKKIINYNELSNNLKRFYDDYNHIFVLEEYFKYDTNEKHKNKSLYYLVKISPVFFLRSIYFINKSFEDYNILIKDIIKSSNNSEEKKKLNQNIIKLFNILPSKNNYYNGYIPFSTTSLAYLLNINITKTITKDNTTSIIQDKTLIENMFNSLFNFNKLKRNNLIFSGHFETDGIGCSLQFYNLNKLIKGNKEKKDLQYLDDVKNKKELRDKKIIGIDPGKYNILYMSDGNKKLRYTINQRKYECGIFKRQNFI